MSVEVHCSNGGVARQLFLAVISGVLVAGGCTSNVTTRDMLAASAAPAEKAVTKTQNRDGPARMESFYNTIRAAAGRQPIKSAQKRDTEAARPRQAMSSSAAERSLLGTELVQRLADAVWEKETTGTVKPTSISRTEIEQLVQQLCEQKETLVAQLRDEKSNRDQPDRSPPSPFADVLVTYLKAYGNGEFVARDGTNISKPSLSGGVSDDDIQGLVLVFCEALYDCLYDMPVLYGMQQTLRTEHAPERQVNGDLLEDGGSSAPVTVTQRWKNEPLFFTNENAEPTAWSVGFARHERVKSEHTPISEKEAKAIRRLSKVAGKQSKSLTGTIFGFLSNVNISVVVGADFAIGDNDTLLHAIETVAEVTGRRSAEYAAYSALSHQSTRSSEESTVLKAVRAMED